MAATGNAELDEAYARLHEYGPEFGGNEQGENGLANHGPMAVEVMVRRGLEVNVDRWLDRYVPRLVEALPGGAPIDDWRAALGQARRLPDWTALFVAELDRAPWRDVLARWWPRLLPGIAAGATHGVIRVGHAVRTLAASPAPTRPELDELAHGLAYWAARYRVVHGVAEPAGDSDPGAALEALTRLAERSGPIAGRLDRLQTTTTWTRDLQRLAATPDHAVLSRLDELITAAVGLYSRYGHGSPVLLVHCATAPNAVRHVLPELPVALWHDSLTAAWVASAAVMATYAPPEPAPIAATTNLDADDVLDLAAAHGDEHVLKFADTARDAYDRLADPDLLAAALRAAELIDRP